MKLFIHDYLREGEPLLFVFLADAVPPDNSLVDIGYPEWHRVVRTEWRIGPRSDERLTEGGTTLRTWECHVFVAPVPDLPVDYEVRSGLDRASV